MPRTTTSISKPPKRKTASGNIDGRSHSSINKPAATRTLGRATRFAGKVVLLTGASGGQGLVAARLLADEGATIVLADIIEAPAKALATQIRNDGGQALFVKLDVTSAKEWQRLAKKISDTFGALHVLINNAGVISRTGIDKIDAAEWQRVIDINMTGPMLGIKTMAPLMRDSGGGAIVNVSSTAGMIAHPGVAYAASKWGVRGVTKCAAMEYLDWNIRVNSVHPAQVADTQMSSNASAGYRYANERAVPMKRPAQPIEAVHAVLFLASDEASYITASEMVIDGGALSMGLPRVRTLLEREYQQAITAKKSATASAPERASRGRKKSVERN